MLARKIIPLALLAATAGAQASDLALEPCINGGVSASGRFASQEAEDQVNAYVDWRLNQPYYALHGRNAALRDPFDDGRADDAAGDDW